MEIFFPSGERWPIYRGKLSNNVVFFSTREITVVFKGRSRRQLTLSSIKSTRRFSSLCRWFISRYSINGINKTIYNILRFIQRRWRLLLWKCFIDFTRVSLSFSTSITINHHFIFSFFFISPHIYVSVFSSGWRNGARDSLCESFFFVVYYFKIVKEKKKKERKKSREGKIFNILTISSPESRKFSYSFI